MVSQNKGNVSGIENSLKALVGHLFGNHECCSSSWCGYQRDKAYQHSKLPYGKDLISQDLKKDLEKLFLGNLMNQAKKLANLSSSQANESLNNTIAFKSPKAKHYSASASLSYRFGTAVLQKKMRDIPMSPRYECTIMYSVKIVSKYHICIQCILWIRVQQLVLLYPQCWEMNNVFDPSVHQSVTQSDRQLVNHSISHVFPLLYRIGWHFVVFRT